MSNVPSPSDALIEALRALVREELKRPGSGPAPERPPTWQDAFWLLLLVVDVVLFVALIPEEGWKTPALEVPGKILPWLGGGTFVLGATWFRERLLVFSRNRASKVILAAGFVPLLLLHVPVVPLWPKVDPSDSLLYVDDKLEKPDVRLGGFRGQARIWLRLKGHTFRIQPYEGRSTKERTINWSWTRLLRVGSGTHRPQWALIYPVTIVTDGAGCKVHIKKFKPEEQLDTDFYDQRLKRVADSLDFEPQKTSETVDLPKGTYKISVEKMGCKSLEYPDPVDVPFPGDLDLGIMDCSGKSK